MNSDIMKRPIRMCVACRRRSRQQDLLRFAIQDGRIILHEGFHRSFYVCRACFGEDALMRFASKNKQLNKSALQKNIQELLATCQK